jgi:hypothetical protein
MNVPGFNADASIYRGQSYRSPQRGHSVPSRAVLQAPNLSGSPVPGPVPGPVPMPSGPCECWKQCVKNKTVIGKANCTRLYHLAKCLNEQNDLANCYGIAENLWSYPPCKA